MQQNGEYGVSVNEQWCKGCGLCVYACSKNVLEISKGKAKIVNPNNCVSCRMCENLCPDYSISVGGKQ